MTKGILWNIMVAKCQLTFQLRRDVMKNFRLEKEVLKKMSLMDILNHMEQHKKEIFAEAREQTKKDHFGRIIIPKDEPK